MITEVQPDLMNDAEQAQMGKRLAQAIIDLDQMRQDTKSAMEELKKGIEAQEVEVRRLVNLVKTGQKELFPEPPKPDGFEDFKNGVKRALGPEGKGLRDAVKRMHDQCDKDGTTATLIMDGEEIAKFGKGKKKKAGDGKSAASGSAQ